jgi:hypothetical protein
VKQKRATMGKIHQILNSSIPLKNSAKRKNYCGGAEGIQP